LLDCKASPWVRGVVDTLVGASIIRKSGIPTKNRLAVILIDTAFETGCRAFLKHTARIKLDQNHSHRENLVKAVRAKLSGIEDTVWDSIDYYYTEIRCDFYHQSAGKTLADTDVLDYLETVEFVIDHAFDIKIADLVRVELDAVQQTSISQPKGDTPPSISLDSIKNQRHVVLVAVSQVLPSSAAQVNEFLRKQGISLRLGKKEFTDIVARNSGTKKFFFFNKELRRWELSALGRFRLEQIVKGETDER